mgnify:CR=1 FL=1
MGGRKSGGNEGYCEFSPGFVNLASEICNCCVLVKFAEAGFYVVESDVEGAFYYLLMKMVFWVVVCMK